MLFSNVSWCTDKTSKMMDLVLFHQIDSLASNENAPIFFKKMNDEFRNNGILTKIVVSTPMRAYAELYKGKNFCLMMALKRLQQSALIDQRTPFLLTPVYAGWVLHDQLRHNSIMIRKERFNDFKPFINNENEIDTIKLIESNKFKTTISFGHSFLGLTLGQIDEYLKKYSNFKSRVFRHPGYQSTNMLNKGHDMDYSLYIGNSETIEKMGLKSNDFLVIPGIKKITKKRDPLNIAHWKEKYDGYAFGCGVNDEMEKFWPNIVTVIKELRKDQKVILELFGDDYNFNAHKLALEHGIFDQKLDKNSFSEIKNLFKEGHFNNELSKNHPWQKFHK